MFSAHWMQCGYCGIHLPLRPPEKEEQAADWQCRNCGQVVLGVFDEDARLSIHSNVDALDGEKVECEAGGEVTFSGRSTARKAIVH